MIELLSLIGSAGAGKAFGMLGDAWANASRRKDEKDEREFQKDLAFRGLLSDYLNSTSEDGGKTSFMSYIRGAMFIMFSFTACAFIGWCAWAQFAYPEVGDLTFQNPEPPQNTISLLAGAIEWSWATKTITRISPLGYAYLALHPLLFILSMVSTLERPRRRG